jgi:hypothetical protein
VEEQKGETPGQKASSLDGSVVRAATGNWERTLDKTLRAALIPYGYTVTIWATGAYIARGQDVPGITALHGFLYLSGALLGFALLVTIAQRRSKPGSAIGEPIPIHPDSSHPLLIAGFHMLAAGIAFGAGMLVKAVIGSAALTWFFAPFVVTLLYLSLSSLELAISVEWHKRRFGPPRLRVPFRRRGGSVRPVSPISYSAGTEYGVEEQSAPRGGRDRVTGRS